MKATIVERISSLATFGDHRFHQSREQSWELVVSLEDGNIILSKMYSNVEHANAACALLNQNFIKPLVVIPWTAASREDAFLTYLKTL